MIFVVVGEVEEVLFEVMIECELIIVICFKMGWVCVMKGYQVLDVEVKFKDGDEWWFMFYVEIMDCLIVVGLNGCFYMI